MNPDLQPAEPVVVGRRQFGLGTLFVIVSLMAVLAAIFGISLRAGEQGVKAKAAFAILAIVGPFTVVIVLNLGEGLLRWIARRRGRKAEFPNPSPPASGLQPPA